MKRKNTFHTMPDGNPGEFYDSPKRLRIVIIVDRGFSYYLAKMG